MKTNINQNTPYRDRYREACFKDAYVLKAEIEVTNFLDAQSNWIQAILKFKHKSTLYGLIENFKQGADNSTDYVVLEINGKEEKRFDTFLKAEIEMVKLMRS